MGMGDYLYLEKPSDNYAIGNNTGPKKDKQMEIQFPNEMYSSLKHIHDQPPENPRIDLSQK